MQILLGIFGIIILISITIDVIWTTLLIGRGGPITSWISAKLWQGMLSVHRKTKSHKILSSGGTILVLVNLAIWVIFLWLGWSLIFLMAPKTVVVTATLEPVSVWETIYYVGFTIITLGVGDLKAGGDIWRILTVLASFNGFIFVTLAITYLVSIVSAVVFKRSIASYITSLGHTPEDIIIRSYQHGHLNNLIPHFHALTPMILRLGQQHLAYPILHTFHSLKPETAVVTSLAALDEALTILEYGVPPTLELPSTTIYTLRRAITIFIVTQNQTVSLNIVKKPPQPDLNLLTQYGIPVVDEETFSKKIEKLEKRRRWLYALVHRDGWNWKEVLGSRNLNYEEISRKPTILQDLQ